MSCLCCLTNQRPHRKDSSHCPGQHRCLHAPQVRVLHPAECPPGRPGHVAVQIGLRLGCGHLAVRVRVALAIERIQQMMREQPHASRPCPTRPPPSRTPRSESSVCPGPDDSLSGATRIALVDPISRPPPLSPEKQASRNTWTDRTAFLLLQLDQVVVQHVNRIAVEFR